MSDPTLMPASGRDTDSAIAQQADAWFALFLARQDTPDDRARWRAWRDADPAHEKAWQRVESVHLHIERKAPPPRRIAHVRRGRGGLLLVLTVVVTAAATIAWTQPEARATLERAVREARTLASEIAWPRLGG